MGVVLDARRWYRHGCAALILAFIAGPCLGAEAATRTTRAQVIVVSTLHQHHDRVRDYSFDALSRIVESLRPHVLAMELTAVDLASRREQKTKQEYQRSIFPLLHRRQYETVALEPSEPKYSELVTALRDSTASLQRESPAKADAFGLFVDTLYERLFEMWDSPLAVNSPTTDTLLAVKHDYQNALYGATEERVWNAWNEHFLERILDAARRNPGKRIIVLVGVEHGYWLRARLRAQPTVEHVEFSSAYSSTSK